MDLKIDPLSGDLVWENGPTTALSLTLERTDVVAQRLRIKLLTFRGEYFLDTQYGLPWWQRILGHKNKKGVVDQIFQTAILEERGVREITFFESTLVNRVYSITFRVKVTSGDETETITITPTA